jgi:ABC-type lipoprotein release transport system permease subunit
MSEVVVLKGITFIFNMATIAKIAWRNLWRNPRRTFITVASIFFGVLLSSYMTSMQEGSYDKIVDLVVKYYSGYIQVHDKEYWQNKSINNSFEYSEPLITQFTRHPEIKQVFPRLESYSLVSSEKLTKGAIVIGIDPVGEDKWTKLSSKIKQGVFLSAYDNGVVIGEGLGQYLKINVNDTLIMVSQGYHGVSAIGKFPVKGIIRHVSPELDKEIVYLDIRACQKFFSAQGRCTSLVINVADQKLMDPLVRKLKQEIRDPLQVMRWEEMQPEVVQQIQSDRAGGIVLKIVLYIVVGFGILTVLMMMISERKKEMGIMVSIGMQRTKLAGILLAETFFIGLFGVAAGLITGIPVVWFQAAHPILLTGKAGGMMQDFGFEPYLFFSTSAKVFINQAITIFIISMVVAIYPVITAFRFNIIKSVRK